MYHLKYFSGFGDEANHGAPLDDVENKNQSIEIHNGLLRKSPPRTLTSYYTSRPTDKVQIPKTSIGNNTSVKGSFTFTTSEPQANDQITTTVNILGVISQIPSSSQEDQTNVKSNNSMKKVSKTDNTPIDIYQHSPALNAFLFKKQQAENSKSTTSTQEPILSDLITLLPYVFESEEEPWKPILPENFTRYPERRPFPMEDYNSEGVGVVEVVLDPGDLTSSVPLKPAWPNLDNPSLSNNDNPININLMPSFNHPRNLSKDLKDIFQPRSDDRVTFVLNTQIENSHQLKEDYDRVHGDILTKHKINKELKENASLLGDSLPDFPILQQFHDLDAFLRSHDFKMPTFNHKSSKIPVTLLPARSNIDIKKRIRPRPTEKTNKLMENHLILEITDSQTRNKPLSDEESSTDNEQFAYSENNESETDITETNILGLQTQIPMSNQNKELTGISKTSLIYGFPTVSKEIQDRTEVYLPSNTDIFLNNTEEVIDKQDKLHDLPSIPDSSYPSTMSARNHHNPKMTNKFHVDSVPLKIDFHKNNLDSELVIIPNVTEDVYNFSQASNQTRTVKLTDSKIQDLLEHMILYNLSTESTLAQLSPSEQEFSSAFLNINQHNLSNDINIAHNRKYGQHFGDQNSLIRNSTIFEGKPDVILYYLKHPGNKSESYSNSYLKNGNNEKNKNASNYVLNKDGFLMLTKVYNKAPSTMQASIQANITENFTTGN